MNYHLFSIGILGTVVLAACTAQQPMGMNHGDMDSDKMPGMDMQGMHNNDDTPPENNADLATLPEALPSEVLEIKDGDTIDLNPEIVKKTTVDADTGEPSSAFAMYAYNGQFPGPLLRVQQGSTFTVRVKNNIDQPTTVHWHGIRLDNKNDGVPDVTQKAIQPGGSHTYTVRVPDEGIFWYHPHVREDVQQDMGLYGGIWVTPKNTKTYATVDREIPVFLDDMLLGKDNRPIPYGKESANFALMGRFGNTYVTNGILKQRFDTLPSWDVSKGSVVRFALLNTANTRTFRIEFQNLKSDQTARMKLVSGDNGSYEREQFVDHVILAPSERAIVDVLFDDSGEYHLLHTAPNAVPLSLAVIAVSATASTTNHTDAYTSLRTHENILSDIGSLEPFLAKKPDEIIHLSVTQSMMGGMNHDGMAMDHSDSEDGIEWEDTMQMMNAMATSKNTEWKLIDEESGKENMDINYAFEKGEKVKIRIINDKDSDHPMQHPIHFHGQRFLVLSVNGTPTENMVWKDTVLVPKDATVDILLDVTNPGDWMIHCHIAEHLSNGMMGSFTVK